MSEAVPPPGRSRWTHYGRRVVREGLPFAWTLVSLLLGFGIVTAVLALTQLSVAWIVGAVFAGLFVIAVVGGYRLWSKEVDRREKAEEPLRSIPDIDIPGAMRPTRRPLATREELESSHIEARTVFVADLPLEGERVRGKVFTDCDLFGPCVIRVALGSTMEVCTIGTLPDEPDAVIWEIPEERTMSIGALVFEACRMVRCRTFGIGFAGRTQELQPIRELPAANNP